MAFALPIVITAAGLGAWIVPRTTRSFGLQWYLGFLSIPVLLLLSNVGLRLPIGVATWLIAGLAAIGLWRSLRSASRTDLAELLVHPVVVLPVAYGLLTAVIRPAPYDLSKWDEVSWWLLEPRQILLAGNPASRTLPVTYWAHYTPGWSHLMAFPFALAGAPLATDQLRWLPFLSAVGVVATTYDLIRSSVPELAKHPAPAWLVVCSLVCLGIGFSVAPPNLLIEAPLSHAWAALLVLALAAGRSLTLPTSLVVRAAAILLAGGYLLKEPFITAAPLAVGAAYIASGRHAAGRRWMAGLFASVPMLVVGALWHAAIHWVRIPSALPTASAPALGEVLAASAHVSCEAIAAIPMHHLAVVAVGLSIGASVVPRVAWAAMLASLACYLLGLLSLYMTGKFAEEQASVIPAFARYMGVVANVVAYGGTALAATAAAYVLRNRPRVGALLLAALAAGTVVTLREAVRRVDGPERLGPTLAALVPTARAMRDVITADRTEPPRLGAFTRDLETGRFLGPLLHYVSLEGGGPPAFAFQGPAIVVRASSPRIASFMSAMSPAMLKRRVRQADAVWVLDADDWVLRLLRRATTNPDCVANGILLLRPPQSGNSRSFRCTPQRDARSASVSPEPAQRRGRGVGRSAS